MPWRRIRRMDRALLAKTLTDSIAVKQRLLDERLDEVEAFVQAGIDCIRRGGKLMFCGNGGSSCDASHAVGELVGWFEQKDRPPFAAIALGHEVPTVTAIGNDAGYEHIFARQVEAIGRSEDLLIGISTSGSSKNVVAAMRVAKAAGMATAAMIGDKPGAAVELADFPVRVPSTNTARIQECHLVCVHMLCAGIELACGSA